MAAGVALTSECKFRHGAVVVRHGKVLAASPNIQKNDPRFVDFRHSQVHAEIAALKKAGWPRGVHLYVVRINRNGEFRLSMPCANCQEVIDEHRVKVVWSE
jgi:hypothetical protein